MCSQIHTTAQSQQTVFLQYTENLLIVSERYLYANCAKIQTLKLVKKSTTMFQPPHQQPPVHNFYPQVPQQQQYYAPQQPLLTEHIQQNEQPQLQASSMQPTQPLPQQEQPQEFRGCSIRRCCKKFNKCPFTIGFYVGLGILAILFTVFSRRWLHSVLRCVPIVFAVLGLKTKEPVFMAIFTGASGFHIMSQLVTHEPVHFIIIIVQVILIAASVVHIKRAKRPHNAPEQQQQQIQTPTTPAEPVAQSVQQQPPMQPSFHQQQPPMQQVYPPMPLSAQPVVQSWASELTLLRDMGFRNEEQNIRLLEKHNGNVNNVVREIISN